MHSAGRCSELGDGSGDLHSAGLCHWPCIRFPGSSHLWGDAIPAGDIALGSDLQAGQVSMLVYTLSVVCARPVC